MKYIRIFYHEYYQFCCTLHIILDLPTLRELLLTLKMAPGGRIKIKNSRLHAETEHLLQLDVKKLQRINTQFGIDKETLVNYNRLGAI